MNTLISIVCLVTALCCMTTQFALVLLIFGRHNITPTAEEMPTESAEEREARRTAMEAQKLYEQGFVNLMNYDGRPVRKERDGQ